MDKNEVDQNLVGKKSISSEESNYNQEKKYKTTNLNEDPSPSNTTKPQLQPIPQSKETVTNKATSIVSEKNLRKFSEEPAIRCICSPTPSDPYIMPCGGTERCETRYGPAPASNKYTNRRGCHHCRNKRKTCSIQ